MSKKTPIYVPISEKDRISRMDEDVSFPFPSRSQSGRKFRSLMEIFLIVLTTIAFLFVIYIWVWGFPKRILEQSKSIQTLHDIVTKQSEIIRNLLQDATRKIETNCDEPLDSGYCILSLDRWYFDAKTGKCTNFKYGGCGGNGNNFISEAECEGKCVRRAKVEEVNRCELEPTSGPCRAIMPRFYFDKIEGKCKKFNYGGCAGNKNNFVTEEECQKECQKMKAKPDSSSKPAPSSSTKEKEEDSKVICKLSKQVGNCDKFTKRWFYDHTNKKCVEFGWSGCGGNANNFVSEAKCKLRCNDRCTLEPEVGFCRAAFQRYFFNSKTKKCELFVYGGCGGNDNNFESLKGCQEACEEIIS